MIETVVGDEGATEREDVRVEDCLVLTLGGRLSKQALVRSTIIIIIIIIVIIMIIIMIIIAIT